MARQKLKQNRIKRPLKKPSKAITVSLRYNDETVGAFYRFNFLVKSPIRIYYYVLSGMIALAGAILIVFGQYLFGGIIFGLSVLAIFLFPWQVRRIIKKKTAATYQRADEEFCFTSEAITQRGIDIDNRYQWLEIKEVYETNYYFYLYITAHKALIVDRQLLADENEAFIDLLKYKGKEIIKYEKL